MAHEYEFKVKEKQSKEEQRETTISKGFRLSGFNNFTANFYLFHSLLALILSMAHLLIIHDIWKGVFFGVSGVFLLVLVNGVVMYHKLNYLYYMNGGDERANELETSLPKEREQL